MSQFLPSIRSKYSRLRELSLTNQAVRINSPEEIELNLSEVEAGLKKVQEDGDF